MASVKALQAVRQHIPMIKFPIRHGNAHAAKPHGLSSSSTQSPGTSSPTTPLPTVRATGFAKSHSELPSRYRRKPIDQVEIDYIQRGGPE